MTRSYRPGLFHGYAVADLPRTNNDLEQLSGSYRRHERRVTGRKVSSPATVLRGPARVVAALATRLRDRYARIWREPIGSVGGRCAPASSAAAGPALRARFRRDPKGIRPAQQLLCQPALPS